MEFYWHLLTYVEYEKAELIFPTSYESAQNISLKNHTGCITPDLWDACKYKDMTIRKLLEQKRLMIHSKSVYFILYCDKINAVASLGKDCLCTLRLNWSAVKVIQPSPITYRPMMASFWQYIEFRMGRTTLTQVRYLTFAKNIQDIHCRNVDSILISSYWEHWTGLDFEQLNHKHG